MFLFLADKIDSGTVTIRGDEAKHAIKVIRLKVGDYFLTTILDGIMYRACASVVTGDVVQAEIIEKFESWEPRDYSLRVCIAPTKNIDRYEWFLEKAVEIGIDRITPICTEHSERKIVKYDRCVKILRSAAKQSLKAKIPQLDEMTDFNHLMQEDFAGTESLFIAHCDSYSPRNDVRNILKKAGDYTFLIGPEGDFSQQEIQAANNKGFNSVSLGMSRMRTETAALWVTTFVSIYN